MVRARRGDSHDSLARSIAREVQARLPLAESASGLTHVIEEALHTRACDIELTLAWLRAAALGVSAVLALAGVFSPELVGVHVPVALAGGLFVALVAASLFALVLRRGWYRPWLRRAVPIADAALIVALVLPFARAFPAGEQPAPSFGAWAACACAFLVLSGSARLSASAQRIAAALGVGAWLAVALILSVPGALLIGVTGFMIVLAMLGRRFATIVRGLVTTEAHGQRLGNMYDDARAAIDAREEVLRIVAHDLRNPLSTISMTAELIRDLPSDEETRAKHVSIIGRATTSMNKLIHDLLDVARLEAGRMNVDPVAVPARTLLDRATELMAPIAAGQDVRVHTRADPDLPDVLVDEERILQVFSNLAGNAVKFTPAGGSITFGAERSLDTVRFTVRDTGPGIPPERAAQIFDRFWQADENDRRGIGLGLAIARSIVEAHGQRIGVDCPPSGGSEFWFTAAVATPDPAP